VMSMPDASSSRRAYSRASCRAWMASTPRMRHRRSGRTRADATHVIHAHSHPHSHSHPHPLFPSLSSLPIPYSLFPIPCLRV
jgi:hypothetical protein